MSASGNRRMQLSVASTLRNPGGNFGLTVHKGEFPTEAFTDNESALFERQFNDLLADFDSSIVTQVFNQRQESIAKAASFAKQEIDGKVFGGVNAGDNQIGFDILRPGHIRSTPGSGNSDADANDWYYKPDSTGWNDWIGGDGNGGTDGSAYSVGEDQVSVIVAFMDQDVSTEISGLNVQQFGRNMDMLPHDLNNARLMDNDNEQMVQNLPTLLAQDNDNIRMRLRHDRIQESQPRLLGVTFALGSFLNTEDYQ